MTARKEREAPDVAAAASRLMYALAKRAGDGELEALEALGVLRQHHATALQAAVSGYRHGPAQASWTDVGRALNMTRQSAWERFGE